MEARNVGARGRSWREPAGPAAGGEPNRPRPPIDLDDPDWAPIHGVTLDRYAELSALVVAAGIEAQQDWLESHGVAPATWAEVDAGWSYRIVHRDAVRDRYRLLRGR